MPTTDYAQAPETLLSIEGKRLQPVMQAINLVRDKYHGKLWPTWCYFPKGAAATIVDELLDQLPHPGEEGEDWGENDIWDTGELAATLSAWRLTRGVYAFDPDLFHALMTTPLTDQIPAELLYRLPEWCVYIPIPTELRSLIDTGHDLPLEGFFARLNYGNQNHLHATDHEGHALTFSFVHAIDDERKLIVFDKDISLKHHSLREGLDHYQADGDLEALVSQGPGYQRHERVERQAQELAPYLNVLLYLCSEKPEIEGKGQPGNPKRVKTKKGWREFATPGTRLWNVGVRIGATLRKENTSTRNEEHDPVTGRARPRPHIRRAHWNTYWTGPKTAPQTPVLRWIPPTRVAADPNSDEELPTTIRPVKK